MIRCSCSRQLLEGDRVKEPVSPGLVSSSMEQWRLIAVMLCVVCYSEAQPEPSAQGHVRAVLFRLQHSTD